MEGNLHALKFAIFLTITIAVGLMAGSQIVFSQLDNTYSNEKCGISIQYPTGWTATESQFVHEDKAKTLADFQSPNDDIFRLDLSIENFGVANRSPKDIANLEKEMVPFGDSSVFESDVGQINGFPNYTIVYVQGSMGEYEFQEEKFHDLEVLVIAYGKEYRFAYEAPDKERFDKYRPIVEEMANTIKINDSNFAGINC